MCVQVCELVRKLLVPTSTSIQSNKTTHREACVSMFVAGIFAKCDFSHLGKEKSALAVTNKYITLRVCSRLPMHLSNSVEE